MYKNSRTRGMVLGVILAGMVLLAADRANAVTTNYDGGGCIALGGSSITISSGVVTATSSPAEIVCPITKTTSGPSTSGDKISAWTATINNQSHSPGIDCQVAVYSSEIDGDTDSNLIFNDEHQSATADSSISRTVNFDMIDGYWGDDIWAYAELECRLQSGEKLSGYSVTESGTDNGNYIYPGFAVCSPVSGSVGYNYYAELSGGNGGPNGLLEAQGGGGSTFFEVACFLPASTAQWTTTPAINSSGWGVSWSSSGSFSFVTGSNSPGSVNYPQATFPGDLSTPIGSVAANGFLDTSSNWYLYFKQGLADGDMGIVSMRITGAP
jgi:hypothetical protein